MGYRRAIHNFEIFGQQFDLVKNKFKNYGFNVQKIYQIRKDRNVYMVEIDDQKHIRLDIYKNKIPHRMFRYQNYLHRAGVNVAKLIALPVVNGRQWRVSEWIEGVRVENVWDKPEVFIKSGEQMAKLNLVKDLKTNNFLYLSDFNKINEIWTADNEVYFIDLSVYPTNDVDRFVVKTLVMGLRTLTRICYFLEGYRKFRSIDKIIDILITDKFRYKRFSILQDPCEDIQW